MLQNNIQSISYLSLLDPSSTDPKQVLHRLDNVHGNCRVYDKETKSDIYLLMKKSSAVVFPKVDGSELGLMHGFLHLQVCFFGGMDWAIELQLSDQHQIKRRITLSNRLKNVQKKNFSIKYPCADIQYGHWLNLTIDLASFMASFGKGFKTVDKINISGFFKLRRIFSTPNQVNFEETQNQSTYLPKKFYFPSLIKPLNVILKYKEGSKEDKFQASESTRNQSNQSEQQLKLPKLKLRQNNCKKLKVNKNVKLPQINSVENRNKENEVKGHKKTISQFLSNSERLDGKMLRFGLMPIKQNIDSVKIDQAKEEVKTVDTQRTSITVNLRYENQSANKEATDRSSRFSSCVGSRNDSMQIRHPVLNNEQIEEDIEFENSFTCDQKASLLIPTLCSKEPSNQLSTIADLELETSKINATSQRYIRLKSFEGFGENVIERYMKDLERPFSPPLGDADKATDSIIEGSIAPKMCKHQLELMYDPILECYYDCKANAYYQLKK